MKNLKLRLDDLAVESFSTTPSGGDRAGTVHAYSGVRTCEDWKSCQQTCGFIDTMCQDTCGACTNLNGCGTLTGGSDENTPWSQCTYGYPGGGDACVLSNDSDCWTENLAYCG